MPGTDQLHPTTRRVARLGGYVSDRRIASLRAAEADLARRVGAIFGDVDVLVTPGTATGPMPIGAYGRRGVLARLAAAGRHSPFVAVFNATGHPAASVPWGLDREGLPTSLQLVGPPDGEALLLAVSAQIEAAHPWVDRRPPDVG